MYNGRLTPDRFGTAERLWQEIHGAWLAKLTDLGGPDTLLSAVRSID